MEIMYTSLKTDNHASTSSLIFHKPDALPDAQTTVSKHWRQFFYHFNSVFTWRLWIVWLFATPITFMLGFVQDEKALKMICNDFLVVKVNCWSHVFNIIQPIWILRNVKNKNIVDKKRLKMCTDDSQVMTSYQENNQTMNQIAYWVLNVDNRSRNNT